MHGQQNIIFTKLNISFALGYQPEARCVMFGIS